jgi:hypothetical protein
MRRREFHPIAPPSDKEAAQVAARIATRVKRLMIRRGIAPQSASADKGMEARRSVGFLDVLDSTSRNPTERNTAVECL